MDQESVQIGFTVQLAILIDWICSMNQVCGTDWICGTNRVCGTDRVVTVQTGLRERTQSQVFSPKVHRGGSVVVLLLLWLAVTDVFVCLLMWDKGWCFLCVTCRCGTSVKYLGRRARMNGSQWGVYGAGPRPLPGTLQSHSGRDKQPHYINNRDTCKPRNVCRCICVHVLDSFWTNFSVSFWVCCSSPPEP